MGEEIAAKAVHATNERLFDKTSVEYSTQQWFEPSLRSPYLYGITRRRLGEALAKACRERVLEIGTGPGTWTRVIASQSAQMTAVDISQEMLSRAHDFVQPYDVRFIHSDVLQLNLAERFDCVVSLRAIEYVVDRAALAEKLSRLVDDEGSLIIVTKTSFSLWRGRRWLSSLPHFLARRRNLSSVDSPQEGEDNGTMYMRRFWPHQLKRLLSEVGFDQFTVRPVIVGLPIIAGVDGDLPLVPRFLAPTALRFFNRLGDILSRLPQWTMPLSVMLSESYLLTAHRHPGMHRGK